MGKDEEPERLGCARRNFGAKSLTSLEARAMALRSSSSSGPPRTALGADDRQQRRSGRQLWQPLPAYAAARRPKTLKTAVLAAKIGAITTAQMILDSLDYPRRFPIPDGGKFAPRGFDLPPTLQHPQAIRKT